MKPNAMNEWYMALVTPARERLLNAPEARALLDPSIDPMLLERFLIQYSVQGVHMTEPVDGWIRRAGEQCVALGVDDIGRSLISHARSEGGHHQWLIDDTRYLVNHWNGRRGVQLDAEALLQQPPIQATHDYATLHESVIAGPLPVGQVAIEFEIENLSLVLGPRLIDHCRSVLGDAIVDGLSFVTRHVALDEGHTALNSNLLSKIIDRMPHNVWALGAAGAQALDIYARYLWDCFNSASAALDSERRGASTAAGLPQVSSSATASLS